MFLRPVTTPQAWPRGRRLDSSIPIHLTLGGDLPKDRADHILRSLGMQCPQREVQVVPAGGAPDGGGEKTLAAHRLLLPDDHRRSTAWLAVRYQTSQRTRDRMKRVRAYTLLSANIWKRFDSAGRVNASSTATSRLGPRGGVAANASPARSASGATPAPHARLPRPDTPSPACDDPSP